MPRPKGSKNKLPAAVAEMFLGALRAVGGQEYLEDAARDPETKGTFITSCAKMIPRDHNLNVPSTVVINVTTGVPASEAAQSEPKS